MHPLSYASAIRTITKAKVTLVQYHLNQFIVLCITKIRRVSYFFQWVIKKMKRIQLTSIYSSIFYSEHTRLLRFYLKHKCYDLLLVDIEDTISNWDFI